MSIRKTLLMLTLNYIVIFFWMFWFRMGEISALIIFPVTMLIAFFDTILAEGRMSAFLWCGNLFIANIAGILLQAYLYARETGDIQTAMLRAVVEIPVAVIIIGITAIISGNEAAKLQKRRRRAASVTGMPGKDIPEYGGRGRNNGFTGSTDRHFSRDALPDEGSDEEYDDIDTVDEDNGSVFRVIKKS